VNVINEERMTTTCKRGAGEETCRFIALRAEGFCCAKNSPLAPELNRRAEAGLMRAKGDNCPGI
jgi:hypothetical protein